MSNIGEEFHIGEVVPLETPAVPDFVPEAPAAPVPVPAQPEKVPV